MARGRKQQKGRAGRPAKKAEQGQKQTFYPDPPASRANAGRVLATGAGATVPRAMGGVKSYSLACWDAKSTQHLPLPISTGPYSVIRATRRVTVAQQANIIGTFAVPRNLGSSDNFHPNAGDWSEVVMVSSAAINQPINGLTNTLTSTVNLDGLGDAATLVPSALSVQIMCPTALQTASGMLYAGLMNTQAAIGARSETWGSYMEKFIQFQNPRILTASQLALRGVQINSYPINLGALTRFTPLYKTADSLVTYNYAAEEPTGFAPIVIYNTLGIDLEVLITIEYRIRFDLDHPASASHTFYGTAPDQVWDRLTRQASSKGNGVIDMPASVANTGVSGGRRSRARG